MIPGLSASAPPPARLVAWLTLLGVIAIWGVHAAVGPAGVDQMELSIARDARDAERAFVTATHALAKVARAPLSLRVAALPPASSEACRGAVRFSGLEPERDGRRELRRLSPRRKVPRLNSEEPPWA